MVAAIILVEHIRNIHLIQLPAYVCGAESVTAGTVLHVKCHGRIGRAVEETHRTGFTVPFEFSVILTGQIDRTGHGNHASIVETGRKIILGNPVTGADVVLCIHAVYGTGTAAADDYLPGIDVVLIGMSNEPCGGCIDILGTDVDGVLESVVSFRRRDKRLTVPAAGGAKAVINGHTYPTLLAKMVIKRVAEGIHPGSHGPCTPE